MSKPSEFIKVTYIKRIGPPTLKQFIHYKFHRQVMNDIKGESGIKDDPSSGRVMLASALKVRELTKGKTSEQLMAEHPEWVEQYKKEYGDGVKNKKA